MPSQLRHLLLVVLIVLASGAIIAQDDNSASMERVETDRIDDTTPIDEYTFTVDNSGSLITAEIEVNDADADLDSVLYLLDEDGKILSKADETADGGVERIEFPQAIAGDYRLIVTRYRNLEGTSSGDYTLRVTVNEQASAAEVAYTIDDATLTAAGFPEVEAKEDATWTILAYYGADTNLEEAIINDVREFELAGGSTDNVHIVLLMDRHPAWSDADEDWIGARLYEVAAAPTTADDDGELRLASTMLADFGETVDSANGELLAQFLVWGLRNYPADNVMVTFGGHGAAWEGVVRDDSGEAQTLMTLPELEAALSVARDDSGIEQFDVVINDACLMGSVEYHNVTSEFFRYSIASPEIVVNPAHDMTLLTEQIKSLPDIDLDLLSVNLIDKYILQDIQLRPGSDTAYLTSAVTLLDEFPPLVTALDEFAAYVREDIATRGTLLGQARANAYVYSGYLGETELVDLGSLMREIILIADDVEQAEYIARAQAVLDALNNAVRYGSGGQVVTARVDSYHNIYFPARSQDFDASYLEIGALSNWGAMLRDYYNSVSAPVWDIDPLGLSFHESTPPRMNITSFYPPDVISTRTGALFELEIIGRNIAGLDLTLDRLNDNGTRQVFLQQRVLQPRLDADGNQVFVNVWRQGANTGNLTLDGRLPRLTDGTVTNFENINVTNDDVVTLVGRYREPDREDWNVVTVVFDRESGEFIRAVTTGDSTAVVDLPVGSVFQSITYLRTADGRVSQRLGNEYTITDEGLSWEWAPADSGEYFATLTVTTLSGEETTTEFPITIDNDDVNPALVAQASTSSGVTIPRPAAWESLAGVGVNNLLAFRTQAADAGQNITVYFLSRDEFEVDDSASERDTLDALLLTLVEKYALDLDSDSITEIELSDGRLALEFDYGQADFVGRGFIVYVPNAFRPVSVAGAQVLAEDAASLEELYPILRDNLLAFNPQEVTANDTSNWRFVANETYVYPMRIEWAEVETDDDWTTWAPDPDGVTFFRFASFQAEPNATRPDLLDTLTTDVLADLDDFEILNTYTLTGTYHPWRGQIFDASTWEAIIYDGVRDGQPVRGRFYVTRANQRAYALNMEVAGDDPDALNLMQTTLEPIVDGFQIFPLPLEQLGVQPTVINTGPEQNFAETDEGAEVLLRYNGASLIVINRLPSARIDLSDLVFVQPAAGDRVPMTTFNDNPGVVRNVDEVRPGDCYQLWLFGYERLGASDYPADICNWVQGFEPTESPFWTSETSGTPFEVYQGDTLLATCLTTAPIPAPEFSVEDLDAYPRLSCLVDLP